MHACATWALLVTGVPRAAKAFRMRAAEVEAALPHRYVTSLAIRPLTATCLPRCSVGIHDAEAGPTRDWKHWDPAAVLLADLQAGEVLPGLCQAAAVEPDDCLRFAGSEVDREPECFGNPQEGIGCIYQHVKDLLGLRGLDWHCNIVHVCHLASTSGGAPGVLKMLVPAISRER